MKLLGTLRSPFVRKVHVVMLEKQVACEFVFDRPSAPATQVPLHNPLGKVPVLVLDDGRSLYDSVVIAEYFDHVGPGPRLVPADFDARMDVLCLQALGDGLTDAIVALTHDERFKAPGCDPQAPWYQKQLKKIERGLATLQARAAGRSFLHGDALTLADICAGMAVAYLDQMWPAWDWRARHPQLAAYAATLLARASFRQTEPPAA